MVPAAGLSIPGANDLIRAAMLVLDGVAVQAHRFGGKECGLGRRERGHTHGDPLVAIPFPRKVRGPVLAAKQAVAH